MTMISLIAAIDEQRGLGKENKLLCHLPADLMHFKAITLGKPVIMGRKTHESIGRVLPGRLNIVVSQHIKTINEVSVVASLSEALTLAKDYPQVMIIGGASLFAEALPLAQQIYLTLIHASFDADVFFPTLDVNEWYCQASSERPHDEKNQYDMTFFHYKRIQGGRLAGAIRLKQDTLNNDER